MTLSINSSRISKVEVEISPVRGKKKGSVEGVSADPVTGMMCRLQNSIGGGKWPSKKTICLLALTAAVALAASGYLAWVAFTSSKVAGCGGGRLFNCGHVISSRWSLWFGIPVSVLAAGLYVTMGAALISGSLQRFSESTRRCSWLAVTVLALSAGMAAIWFVSLQFFALGHLCTYCLIAHGCGLVAATTILVARPNGLSGLKIAVPIALAGFAVLAGVQLASEDPATFKIETFKAPAGQVPAEEFEAPVFDAPTASSDKGFSGALHDVTVSSRIVALLQFAKNPTGSLNSLVVRQKQEPQKNSQDDASNSQAQSTDSEKQESNTNSTDKAQTSDEEKQPEQPATKSQRFVKFNGGTTKLDVAQWPIAGSTEAKYIFVEMFDYSCPHCRNTHAAIKGASNLLNGEVAVITLPVPLNAGCNIAIQVTDPKFVESCEISKLAVAVWRVSPAKFTEFHNWIFSTETAQTYVQAKAMADTMVDADKLNKELASDVPAKYIAQHVELYKRVGSGNVPKLIFPSTSIVGEFTSSNGLVEIIQQQPK